MLVMPSFGGGGLPSYFGFEWQFLFLGLVRGLENAVCSGVVA
jgi:hypothetical protein